MSSIAKVVVLDLYKSLSRHNIKKIIRYELIKKHETTDGKGSISTDSFSKCFKPHGFGDLNVLIGLLRDLEGDSMIIRIKFQEDGCEEIKLETTWKINPDEPENAKILKGGENPSHG